MLWDTQEKKILENIKDIVTFFKELFGISFLGYRRIYNDNTIFLLTPVPELKEYTKNSLVFIGSSLLNKIRLNNSLAYQFHYCYNINDPICEFLYKNNLCYGINIFKKYQTYSESFAFCSSRTHYEIVNFYLNNLPLLQQFIFYFRDKFHFTKHDQLPKVTLSNEYNNIDKDLISSNNGVISGSTDRLVKTEHKFTKSLQLYKEAVELSPTNIAYKHAFNITSLKIEGNSSFNKGMVLDNIAYELQEIANEIANELAIDQETYHKILSHYQQALEFYRAAQVRFYEGWYLSKDARFKSCIDIVEDSIRSIQEALKISHQKLTMN